MNIGDRGIRGVEGEQKWGGQVKEFFESRELKKTKVSYYGDRVGDLRHKTHEHPGCEVDEKMNGYFFQKLDDDIGRGIIPDFVRGLREAPHVDVCGNTECVIVQCPCCYKKFWFHIKDVTAKKISLIRKRTQSKKEDKNKD